MPYFGVIRKLSDVTDYITVKDVDVGNEKTDPCPDLVLTRAQSALSPFNRTEYCFAKQYLDPPQNFTLYPMGDISFGVVFYNMLFLNQGLWYHSYCLGLQFRILSDRAIKG